MIPLFWSILDVAILPCSAFRFGTTSSSDMTGFEASGGCYCKVVRAVFVISVDASVISCYLNVTQPHIFSLTQTSGPGQS